jgi:hypothetical protein
MTEIDGDRNDVMHLGKAQTERGKPFFTMPNAAPEASDWSSILEDISSMVVNVQ